MFHTHIWFLPLLIFSAAFALAVPIGLYMARVFDGRLRTAGWLRWIEARLDTGRKTGSSMRWRSWCSTP